MLHFSHIRFYKTFLVVISAALNFISKQKHQEQYSLASPSTLRLQMGHSVCLASHWEMHPMWQRCLHGISKLTNGSRQKEQVSFFFCLNSLSSCQISSKAISCCDCGYDGAPILLISASRCALKPIKYCSLQRLKQQQEQVTKKMIPRHIPPTKYAKTIEELWGEQDPLSVNSYLLMQKMQESLGQIAQLLVEQGVQIFAELLQYPVLHWAHVEALLQETQAEGQLRHWLRDKLQYCDDLQVGGSASADPIRRETKRR